jgi:hypothetical protein
LEEEEEEEVLPPILMGNMVELEEEQVDINIILHSLFQSEIYPLL